MKKLRVVILKPSKYALDGYVDRYRWGFMPNSTVPHLRSMTPDSLRGAPLEVLTVDEYVHTDLDYLALLRREPGYQTLLAIVGVQSHQLHRALDLTAYAHQNGCLTVIGGPHPMTCDTSMLQGRGVSFALSEAELVWLEILQDAMAGELKPLYGQRQRWQQELNAPVIIPPSQRDLKRYVIEMLGLYPARGCPFTCNYCSVIKIAGRRVRSQSVETTMRSLRAAKAAGIKMIMFTSDNFNKYAQAEELLTAMIDEKLDLKFFIQCDAQIAKQEKLIELSARAGCFEIFVGVESFNRNTLLAAKKGHNHPEHYKDIVDLCRVYGISSQFSNIIGFPNDTASSINDHIDALCELSPLQAAFYILCPIPGTEQYGEFLSKGLIFERNLDRFDGTILTWNHPHLSRQELTSLLYRCYTRFYSVKHTISSLCRQSSADGKWFRSLAILTLSSFSRYSAIRRSHPMSGGVKRVYQDSASDYLPLRKKMFDFEFAPLPQILQLPEADQALNRRAKIS
ncbi:MAG TPA: B12-binding domain-containing radical SAM protein [Candidatus Saccharimonadales bacterium]|nr:B12-binding domain-containing radical SAM protein [Candidatus Saccharimonadales bacterium]